MMLLDAMATGKLPARNGIVVEGTSGRCVRAEALIEEEEKSMYTARYIRKLD